MVQEDKSMNEVLSALFPAQPSPEIRWQKKRSDKGGRKKEVRKRIDFNNSGSNTGGGKKQEQQEATLSRNKTDIMTDSGDSGKRRGPAVTKRTASMPITIEKTKNVNGTNHGGRMDTGRKVSVISPPHRQSPTNYAGAKFSESPSAKFLPPPPVDWVTGGQGVSVPLVGMSPLGCFRPESHGVTAVA